MINELLGSLIVNINTLKEDSKNARSHSKASVDAIAKSLQAFGQQKPIVVHRSKVIAGNGTLRAARQLGWSEIAVVEFSDEKKARAFALADNRTAELSSWDDGVLLESLREIDIDGLLDSTGFSGDDIQRLMRAEMDRIEAPDEAPDLPTHPNSVTGGVYQLGDHVLVCGDSCSTDTWSSLLGTDKAQMVWTDPPYGVSYTGGPLGNRKAIENDALSSDELRSFLRQALGCAVAASKPGAAWYVSAPSGALNGVFADVLGPSSLDIWRHTLIWLKDSFVLGRSDYHYRHEPIFYGWVNGDAHYFVDDRKQDSVLEVARPKKNRDHPTMKPVELVARCIRNSSKPGWIVADPFGGSGTTLLASAQEGRRARVIEIDPCYCDVIRRRWTQYAHLAGIDAGSGALE